MKFLREQKAQLSGKIAVVRTDLDAAHQGNVLTDDYRIKMSADSIKFLLENGAGAVLISKIGRPKVPWDPEESLLPAARRLAEILGLQLQVIEEAGNLGNLSAARNSSLVFFRGDIRKPENSQAVKTISATNPVLLENIRYYAEEEACDQNFARLLASFGQVFVFDAFAMAHRNEASVSMLSEFLPAYAGLNLEKELNAMDKILHLNQHPFLSIMGGAKISDKVGFIRNIAKIADNVLLGGGLANLFLFAKGYEVGQSLCEKASVEIAQELLRNFKDKLILPVDLVVSKPDFSGIRICKPKEVGPSEAIFDIGPQTILLFSKYIKSSRKMVWNGPLGLFEQKAFSHGTFSIALLYASKCRRPQCFGAIGGGDTLSAITQAGVLEQIDFASTAGGAMLDYLAGQTLSGIAALL